MIWGFGVGWREFARVWNESSWRMKKMSEKEGFLEVRLKEEPMIFEKSQLKNEKSRVYIEKYWITAEKSRV